MQTNAGKRWSLCLILSLASICSVTQAEEPAKSAAPIRVTVWDEQQPRAKKAYENFLGNAIADHLRTKGFEVKSVRLDDLEQGLSADVISHTDVLIWWGHVRHREVKPETGQRLVGLIKEGKLSLIALHSAHWSTPFVEAMCERTRMDTAKEAEEAKAKGETVEYFGPVLRPCKRTDEMTPRVEHKVGDDGKKKMVVFLPRCIFPAWRADAAPSHVTTAITEHPIAAGLPKQWDVAHTEMYDEPFHIPTPDAIIFEEHWDKGEHFRAGCLWNIGKGQVFYFRPGHEEYGVYKEDLPLKVLENACRYLGSELKSKAK